MKIKSNQRKWLTLPQNGQLNFLTYLFPAAMAALCLVGPLCLPLRHFKPTPDLTVTLRMSMALSLTFDLDIDNDVRQVWFKMFPIYLQWSVINIIGCTIPPGTTSQTRQTLKSQQRITFPILHRKNTLKLPQVLSTTIALKQYNATGATQENSYNPSRKDTGVTNKESMLWKNKCGRT